MLGNVFISQFHTRSHNLAFAVCKVLGQPGHQVPKIRTTVIWKDYIFKVVASSSSYLSRQIFVSKVQVDPCGSTLVNYGEV